MTTAAGTVSRLFSLLGELMNIHLICESHPFAVARTIRRHGLRFAYWNLRNAGASRLDALRSIFFGLGV